MSEPLDPEYAAALDRLLDGITADGEADAEVRADTDAIARALGLIGDALGAEGGGVTAAAGAVPPAAAGGTVVELSSWRSRLNPRVLAAAASLLVVLGIGIPLTIASTGGSNSNDATTAAGAPEAATERSGNAPMAAPGAVAPEADDYAGAEALSTTDTGAKAAAPAPATTGGTAAGSAGGAPVAGSASASKTTDAARQAATPQFADAVACARAIVVGTIAAVQPAADGSHYDVTIVVEDWIAPESGPATVTHRVFGSTANSPGEDESVRAGMRRLFVVAASPEERIYAFRPADWPETKKRIAAIRAERAGAGC